MARALDAPRPMVNPSGRARAIASVPTTPPEPGRFSTTNRWPVQPAHPGAIEPAQPVSGAGGGEGQEVPHWLRRPVAGGRCPSQDRQAERHEGGPTGQRPGGETELAERAVTHAAILPAHLCGGMDMDCAHTAGSDRREVTSHLRSSHLLGLGQHSPVSTPQNQLSFPQLTRGLGASAAR